MLWFVAILLSCANFIAVLDMTIANVSVSSIAGNLGVTTSQGTWVITSYAVAEAITVPLTGWLAAVSELCVYFAPPWPASASVPPCAVLPTRWLFWSSPAFARDSPAAR